MPLDDVLTFAQDLAQKDMEGGFHGISPGEVSDWARDWAELVWPENSDERSRFELQMSQIAFFERGAAGRLKFVHEILELHLIGMKYIDYLKRGETAYFIDSLNHWEFPSDSITLDLLSGVFLRSNAARGCREHHLWNPFRKPKALKNMLQLLNNSKFGYGFLGKNPGEARTCRGSSFQMLTSTASLSQAATLTLLNSALATCGTQSFPRAIISNTGFLQHDLRTAGGS